MSWELRVGSKVETTDYKTATVLQASPNKTELGEGGQGIVYLVDCDGEQRALKWYKPSAWAKPDEAYENIQKNIDKKSPADAFLWPLHLTEKVNGTFGYIMHLRPKGYEDVAKFLNAKVRFENESACVNACLKMVNAFKEMHSKGYSCQDINDGNFFIHPKTGDILVCDNDNVAEYGATFGIGGKAGYMAPEIVLGESAPDIFTDRFSMAVMLFLLMVLARPFEGKMTTVPLLTEELEREFFGKHPVFIFDPNDDKNRPVRGVHTNADMLWPTYPKYIQDAFIQTFTIGLKKREERVTDNKWEELLLRLRDEMIVCPICGWGVTYNTGDTNHICPNPQCRFQFPNLLVLKGKRFGLVISPGAKLYATRTDDGSTVDKISGEVVRNVNNPQLWGIRNLSDSIWYEVSPDGRQRAVGNGEVAHALRGIQINFNSGAAVIN